MMRRKVKKVIRALRKKGMTQAFIAIGDKEFIYPPVKDKRKILRTGYVIGLIAAILLLTGYLLFNPLLKSTLKTPGDKNDNINRKDTYGMSKLHLAVIYSDLEQVKQLTGIGARINIRDDYGWTPLHWAVFIKNRDICRFLLQEKASLSIKTKRKWFKYPAGIIPVEIARINGDPAILTLLESK